MPDAAIFADTQAEPASVYRWLDWLEKQLPFPVYRVTNGSLENEAKVMRISKKGVVYSRTDLPFHTLSATGAKGIVGQRSCTADYKIKPIIKEVRKIAKIKRGQKEVTVIQWIGISSDEMLRMKPSREKWCEHRWPLVELRMTRLACLDWMRKRGYPEPPRSACVFCPFHSATEWRRLKNDEPEEFERAVQFERVVQLTKSQTGNFSSIPFLTKHCKPLDTIDFRSLEDKGQLNLWQNECEGMCGN
jgi:hypothetical protein